MKRTEILSNDQIQLMKDMKLAGLTDEEIELQMELRMKKNKPVMFVTMAIALLSLTFALGLTGYVAYLMMMEGF